MASSFHLRFSTTSKATSCEAYLEVVTPPASKDNWVFWALQASIYNAAGQSLAAVHLGLQHNLGQAGGRGVNFGGYLDATGAELSGTKSPLPSKSGNPNTRDYPWSTGKQYPLKIMISPAGTIRGLVAGKLIRTLSVPGAVTLGDPWVWTEDFRPCTAPRVSARWSRLKIGTTGVRTVTALYNLTACADTNSKVEGDAWRQDTHTKRTTAATTKLKLP